MVRLGTRPRSHPHCADAVTVAAPESGSSVTVEVLCFSVSGSDPIAIRTLFCISRYDQFGCDVTLTGGFGLRTIRWEVDGSHVPAFDDRVSMTGLRCPAGEAVHVRVEIRDSLGDVDESSKEVVCH